MGAIGEALGAFAQPLLDQTDGSPEQLEKAFTISNLCFSLAQLPEDGREALLNTLQSSLKMDDEKFDEFRRCVILPMIARHEEMFPRLHGRDFREPWQSSPSLRPRPSMAMRAEKPPVIDRYAPCPCNSGKKYKFCCGAKVR
ncbi:MAG TPA: SEC-C metal-binding domain-containing protein [Pirellulales bacterium]|nr:SEC-C metal-binding domain-containing protein [Pirellulales bacterium]HVA49981.1 SEC-C metal-binding domain-containing protein [Pirellulales bacterium]